LISLRDAELAASSPHWLFIIAAIDDEFATIISISRHYFIDFAPRYTADITARSVTQCRPQCATSTLCFKSRTKVRRRGFDYDDGLKERHAELLKLSIRG